MQGDPLTGAVQAERRQTTVLGGAAGVSLG